MVGWDHKGSVSIGGGATFMHHIFIDGLILNPDAKNALTT